MENAIKAFLIAAAILLVVMILSLVVMSYNQTSDFFQREHKGTVVEQLERFNRQFDAYSETVIRGNEMLSVINKVIDYNTLQADNKGYDKITLKINKMTPAVKNQFKYDSSDSSILDNINTKGSAEISDKVNQLLNKANSVGIVNMTETHLQTLSANIANIVPSDSSEESNTQYVAYRNKLIKNVLGIDITNKPVLLSTIQSITRQYYQLTQFKRAKFECIAVEHSKETGRVIKMEFSIMLDSDGNIIFD